jgi:hypothetical protein
MLCYTIYAWHKKAGVDLQFWLSFKQQAYQKSCAVVFTSNFVQICLDFEEYTESDTQDVHRNTGVPPYLLIHYPRFTVAQKKFEN